MRTWKPLAPTTPPPNLHRGGQRTVHLTCRFISPVFGGGVNPKQVDPITPVRVPSIRGHLRFWWRATHGHLSLEELRTHETALFGGVHGPNPTASRVFLQVNRQPKAPQRIEVFQQGNPFQLVANASDALAYGAFPLRGVQNNNRHDFLWDYQDTFEIELRYSEEAAAGVERALWAWLHFGGLGGRTRRGFGAIELVASPNWKLPSIRDGWPANQQRRNARWPVLGAYPTTLKIARTTYGNGRSAQEALLGLLRRMRQGDLGRTLNRLRPGRSKWPEPDALRMLFGITARRHTQPIHNPRINKFPRGRFGAPIIFHFKRVHGQQEPPNSTLVPVLRNEQNEPQPLNRLASPLILRPHARGDGKYEALALVLDHPALDGWAILSGQNNVGGQSIRLDEGEARRIVPLNLDNQAFTDPIQAYLARLTSL